MEEEDEEMEDEEMAEEMAEGEEEMEVEARQEASPSLAQLAEPPGGGGNARGKRHATPSTDATVAAQPKRQRPETAASPQPSATPSPPPPPAGRATSKVSRQQKDWLIQQLAQLNTPGGRILLTIPSLHEFIRSGQPFVLQDENGEWTIHLDAGKRVSCNPGAMGFDNDAQQLANELPGAAQQALVLKKDSRRLGRLTRNFNLHPRGLFGYPTK